MVWNLKNDIRMRQQNTIKNSAQIPIMSQSKTGETLGFFGCVYLSLTRLSEYGFRGLRFIISDSAASYASEIAGTYNG